MVRTTKNWNWYFFCKTDQKSRISCVSGNKQENKWISYYFVYVISDQRYEKIVMKQF